ncbi:MAG: phosphoribosylglycinamide formyltransferase [Zavarzinia sp.]|nr:phosphoribosylglycinamide formyltransferase [Zavarzinia sp.]
MNRSRKLTNLTVLLGLCLGMAGCGAVGTVVALPLRAASAVVKVVPVAGDVVAAPLDITADVID